MVRLGNLLTAQGSQTTDLGMYAAKTVAANAAEAKKVPGIYFLENSVKKELSRPETRIMVTTACLMPRSTLLILQNRYGIGTRIKVS